MKVIFQYKLQKMLLVLENGLSDDAENTEYTRDIIMTYNGHLPQVADQTLLKG